LAEVALFGDSEQEGEMLAGMLVTGERGQLAWNEL